MLMYVVINFSICLLSVLNEFIYYKLVSLIIDDTAKLLVVNVITVMHNKYILTRLPIIGPWE